MIFNSKSGWKWLSATLLPVLGFVGCGNPGDSPDLYGTPTSDYQFKGRVTDADGKPVEGIKVVSGIVEGDRVFHEDSVSTDVDGHFVTNRKSSTSIEWQVRDNMRILTFEDTKNGIFANDTVRSVDMTVKQLQKGNGAWDRGSFEVTVPDKKLKRR